MFRDVEELLASKGVIVSYEAVRLWCGKFGPEFVRKLRPHRRRLGRRWFVDEVFIRINGTIHYLWRAVDQNGVLVDVLVQAKRDRTAAERFFRHCYIGRISGGLTIYGDWHGVSTRGGDGR